MYHVLWLAVEGQCWGEDPGVGGQSVYVSEIKAIIYYVLCPVIGQLFCIMCFERQLKASAEEKTRELVASQSMAQKLKAIHMEQCKELEKQIELVGQGHLTINYIRSENIYYIVQK